MTGFKQDFARIYDCEDDAFIFQKYGETKLNTADVLNSESAWDGKRLTGDDVLDLCEHIIEEVCLDCSVKIAFWHPMKIKKYVYFNSKLNYTEFSVKRTIAESSSK